MAGRAGAAEWRGLIGPEFGYISGHSTYHISSYSGTSGVESELEFPLRAFLSGLRLTLQDETLQVDATFLTNIDPGSGRMKDSDWLTNDLDIQEVGQAHPGLDIYSESNTDLRAYVLEASLKTVYPLSWAELVPAGGLIYQYFYFDVYDTVQVGYGPYEPAYTVTVPGKTMEYTVEYFILFLGSEIRAGSGEGFSFSFGAFFCPYVYVSDRDDHILRYKLSEAETDGTGYMARVAVQWDRTGGDFSVVLRANYLSVDTTGTQTQTFYGGTYAGQSYTLDDTITSEQWTTTLSLLWRF